MKRKVALLVNKLSSFYGNRMFITPFTTATTGVYPQPVHSIVSRFLKNHFNIALHLHLSFPNLSFPSLLPTHCNAYYMLLPLHPTYFKYSHNKKDMKDNSQCPTLCNLPHPPVNSPLLGKDSLFCTFFSITLTLFPSVLERDQVSRI